MPGLHIGRVLCLTLAASALTQPTAAQTPPRQPTQERPSQGSSGAPKPDATDLLTPLVPPSAGGQDLTIDDDFLEPLVPRPGSTANPGVDDDFLPPLVPRPGSPNDFALDDDRLEPLVARPGSTANPGVDDDFLPPLTPREGSGNDLALDDDRLEPLVPRPGSTANPGVDDDFIPALTPVPTPDPDVVPRDLDYLDYLEVKEAQEREERETVMVRRVRVDPCGDFEVSWSGVKTCHARERIYYELAYVDEPPEPAEEEGEAEEPDWGLGMGDAGPSGGLGGASTQGPSGPIGAAPVSAGDGASSAGTSAPASGAASGAGQGSATALGTPARAGHFVVRLDRASVDAQGRLNVRLALTTGAPAILRGDDWTAVAVGVDGRQATSNALWMAAEGSPQPLPPELHVAAGDTVLVRLVIPLQPGHAAMATLLVQQRGAAPVIFDLEPFR